MVAFGRRRILAVMDRALPMRTEEALRLRDEAIALLGRMPDLTDCIALGLCGSVARGTAGPHSDVDVFVIVSGDRWSDEEERRWRDAVGGAVAPLGRDVSVIVYTPAAIRNVGNWYVLRLASDAVFVHDTAGRVETLFRRVTEKAMASGFVERDGGGHPYWEYAGDASGGWKLTLEDE